jgi:hypothetical protein
MMPEMNAGGTSNVFLNTQALTFKIALMSYYIHPDPDLCQRALLRKLKLFSTCAILNVKVASDVNV